MVQIPVEAEGILEFPLGVGAHIGAVGLIGRQKALRLRRQHRAAAVGTSDGGGEQLAPKHCLSRAMIRHALE